VADPMQWGFGGEGESCVSSITRDPKRRWGGENERSPRGSDVAGCKEEQGKELLRSGEGR
jgi:hypothetical protein